MGNLHLDKHISRQFNQELEDVRNRVLAMGGMVQQQIARAIQAVVERDGALGEQVVQDDAAVNDLEIAIDEECSRIIARRQPTASDLRLIWMILKTTTDLERMGDEAEKIGKMAVKLAEAEAPQGAYTELENLGAHVGRMVHDALDAFARMDTQAAVQVAGEDRKIDREYESIVRQQITYMMEDPRNIRRALDVTWAARALERIGDHARNIGEYVVYLVAGKDMRHSSVEDLAREVGDTTD